MRTPEEELAVLRRRYTRMLKFDRLLFAVYGLTALIPTYAAFTREGDRMFHAVSALLVAMVGGAGVYVDTRVLRGKLQREAPAYAVTAGMVLSRFGLAVWAIGITYPRIMNEVWRDVFGSSTAPAQLSLSQAAGKALDVFLEPAIIWVLFPVAFYRVLYHISVHFLMRIQATDRKPAWSEQTTSLPHPAMRSNWPITDAPTPASHE